MIRQGDKGSLVESIQKFLIGGGFLDAGQDDGHAGPITIGAFESFLRRHGWQRPGTGIPVLVRECAERLGIKPAVLEGFRRVESGSAGPRAIRFEPHLFLRSRPGADIPYTPSERGPWSLVSSETDLQAFQRAYAIDQDVAVRSTSWGLFQVLGGYLLAAFLGPNNEIDPERAVLAFWDSAETVSYKILEAWFRGNPRALAAAQSEPPDLRNLVRYYNGSGQVERYFGLLSAAIKAAEEG